MNRNALLLYIRDLRDLEVAKYQLTKVIQQNTNRANTITRNLQQEINQVQQPYYKEQPPLPEEIPNLSVIGISISVFSFLIYRHLWTLYVLLFLASLGLLAISFVGWLTIKKNFVDTFFSCCIRFFLVWAISLIPAFFSEILYIQSIRTLYPLATLCGIGIIIYSVVRYIPPYAQQCNETETYNRQEAERLTHVPALVQEKTAQKQALINSWKTKDTILKRDLQKANALLQKAYSQNLLASTYRNLASVYYIYDYMSTSTASLEETLIHEHMENGIQRILSKLDVILSKQEEQIISIRRLESNTKTIIEQNEHMLDTLQQTLASQLRTEQNTLEAAQYARIASNYMETTAFFSSASYFQNGGSLLIR